MTFNYIISVIFLFISFLMYPKSNKSLSIVNQIIYSIGLFFCYQVVMVCFLSYIKLGGSLLNYSLFNYIIGFILDIIMLKLRKVQQYYFKTQELLWLFLIIVSTFLVVLYRFHGFTTLSYASDDAAIHYRAALAFSQVLEKLTSKNYYDIILNTFDGMMPISYVNGGMLIRIFSSVSSYKVFMFFDGFCFMLSTMLFFITIDTFIKKKSLYIFILSMLYGLGFPLNNFIFGFCYLGLGVIVIQLLLYTMMEYKDSINKDIIFKGIILFMLLFSVFFSYYLFMPFIYLSIFIYYLYLFKNKKINFNIFSFYLIGTLIIPFIIGFITYFLNFFKSVSHVMGAISLNGDIYNNISPILFFFLINFIVICYWIKYKKKNFFYISFLCLSCYVLIFFFLYLFNIVSFYYFCKLFYIYWVYALLFIGIHIYRYRIFMYLVLFIVIVGSVIVINTSSNNISNTLSKFIVYDYNARNFRYDDIRFYKRDLELVDNAIKYKKVCEYNNEFLSIGYTYRNMWFYSITGSIPIWQHKSNDRDQLYVMNVFFQNWEELDDYPCLLYFYDNNKLDYDKDKYKVLFENDRGIILKKK